MPVWIHIIYIYISHIYIYIHVYMGICAHIPGVGRSLATPREVFLVDTKPKKQQAFIGALQNSA